MGTNLDPGNNNVKEINKSENAFKRTVPGGWFILFALLNLLLIIFLYSTNNLATAENDEYTLSSYQSGVYGEYLPDNALDQNIVFSSAMSLLFKLFPVCNWMILTFVLLYYFSYNTFMHVITVKTRNAPFSFIVSVLILIFTYSYTYKSINNCSVSGLAALAGMLLIVCALDKGSAYFEYAAGVIMLCLSFAIRRDAALLAMAFGLIFAIAYLKDKKLNAKVIISALIPILLFGALFVINAIHFSTPEWKDALERTELREYVNDKSSIRFGAVRYDDGSDEDKAYWEGLGIDREDCRFLTSWYCADSNVYNKELLTRLVEYDKQYQYTKNKYIRWALKAVLSYMYIIFDSGQIGLFILSLCIFAVTVFAFAVNKKRRLETIVIYLLTDAEISYCMMLDRLLDRVLIIPLLCSLMITLYFLSEVKSVRDIDIYPAFKKSRILNIILICAGICVIACVIVIPNKRKEIEYRDWDSFAKFKEKVDTTGSRDLFILSSGGLKGQSYSLFECPCFGIYKDCISDTGWGAMLLYTHDKLEEFGYRNSPYECMLNRDHIYFLGHSYNKSRLDFIRRHYDKDIDICRVYSEGELSAYSITAALSDDDSDDIGTWSIDPLPGTDDDFRMIEGTIEGYENDDIYFIELNDGTQKYWYEIRIEDGSFSFGVPLNTWENSEKMGVRLLKKHESSTIVDDDETIINW